MDSKWTAGEKGVGLDFRFTSVLDEAGDATAQLGVWRLQGDASVHGALLSNTGADAVVLVADLSQPWNIEASLGKWWSVLVANQLAANVVVVGTKADKCPEPHEGIIAAMRSFCVAHNNCGLAWLALGARDAESIEHGTLVRRMVEVVAGARVGEMSLKGLQPDEAERLLIPPGWDTSDKLAALGELPAIPLAPATATTTSTGGETSVEEAEDEQAWLLRHSKLLETLRAEAAQPVARVELEVMDAPATPARGGGDVSTPTTPMGTPGFVSPAKTPLKTPSSKTPSSKTPGRNASASSAAAALVQDGDHDGLADFFNSLLTKDKSPARGTPK